MTTVEDFIAGAITETDHMAAAVGAYQGDLRVSVRETDAGLEFRVTDPGVAELFEGVLPVRVGYVAPAFVERLRQRLQSAVAEIGAPARDAG